MNKQSIIILSISSLIIGILFYLLYNKRRDDIIKICIRRDKLPEPAKNEKGEIIPWLQNGSCFMSDGKVGRVNENYCELIEPL